MSLGGLIDPSTEAPYAAPVSRGMQHHYYNGGLDAQQYPGWPRYGDQQTPITPGDYVSQAPKSFTPQPRPPEVYHFIPGQELQPRKTKRPRRRYEQIKRLYKCSWNGCKKGYGTLNHLNTHIAIKSHGRKWTPEESKEILTKSRAGKKEDEHRLREAAAAAVSGAPTTTGASGGQSASDGGQSASSYVRWQLRAANPGLLLAEPTPVSATSGAVGPALPSLIPVEYNSSGIYPNYPPASFCGSLPNL